MDQAPRSSVRTAGKVVDFDEVLLDACPTARLAELMTEAALLAGAFAPEGRTADLQVLARSLQSGARDLEMSRGRARLIAAALRRLAREAEGRQRP